MAGFLERSKGFATKTIHAGYDPEEDGSMAVVPPIVTSTTFKQIINVPPKLLYARVGNPCRNVLEKCLASLEDAKHCVTFASGMSAISNIMQLLGSGDHILSISAIYGGTYSLITDIMSRQGIDHSFVCGQNMDHVANAIRKNTRMIWMESPTNPSLRIIDIAAIAKLAHFHPNIIVVIDNTFMSPYFQRPLDLGVDIVCYSISKYLNGHGDVIMGAATLNDDNLHKRLRYLQYVAGSIPSPFDCFQVNRGLKTLSLRLEQHSKNSLAVAKFLESHSNVESVLHPALPSHPGHELAMKQSYGHSGVLSFYIKGGLEESRKFIQHLKFFTMGGSLGGYESLVAVPAIMSHSVVPEKHRLEVGITDALIRLSVGLEDVEDLIADIDQALIKAFDPTDTTEPIQTIV